MAKEKSDFMNKVEIDGAFVYFKHLPHVKIMLVAKRKKQLILTGVFRNNHKEEISFSIVFKDGDGLTLYQNTRIVPCNITIAS